MAVFLAAVAFLSYIFSCLSLDRISFSVYFAVFHEFSIDFTVWSFVFTLCRPTVISICISLLLHKERVRQRSNNDNFADRQHGLCEPKLIWLELCVCVFFCRSFLQLCEEFNICYTIYSLWWCTPDFVFCFFFLHCLCTYTLVFLSCIVLTRIDAV